MEGYKMNEIREIRKRAGLTQAAFGELLGIPRRTIQNWEGGQRKCPDYVVALIRYRMEGWKVGSER